MKITGTIINYYFHCKRQCYLFANKVNLEDNSEDVRIGKVLHEIRAKDNKNSEIKYENIVLDKVTSRYVEEYKKSDADSEAAKMQLLFYLKQLQDKGITKEGKLIYDEKNNREGKKSEIIKLDDENTKKLDNCVKEIENLLKQERVPDIERDRKCKKCAYYDYCYL